MSTVETETRCLTAVREEGMFQDQALTRSTPLADIPERVSVEAFVVGNGPGRPIGDVAREVLSLAGWL